MSTHYTAQSNSPVPDEAHQVRLAKSGDSEAFARLYDAYIARVYRYIFFRVSDEHLAEDLASQVFLKAWEKLDRYRARGVPFIAWLYTIARNLVIDHYRTKKESVPLEAVAARKSSEQPPEEQAELRFEIQAMRAALQHLTEDQQQVLTLKFIDGLPTGQVAKIMNKRKGAVRALQMRALRALSKIMEEMEVI